jgi:hypothetical protein
MPEITPDELDITDGTWEPPSDGDDNGELKDQWPTEGVAPRLDVVVPEGKPSTNNGDPEPWTPYI